MKKESDLLTEILRLSELSYRRGVQQGMCFANEYGMKHDDEVVTTWRFNRTISAPLILPVGEETEFRIMEDSIERVEMEIENKKDLFENLIEFINNNKPKT